jgi:uncharacterized membrane protein
MKPVLLAGESFHVTSFAAKGYEVGASARYTNGAERYIQGLAAHSIAVVQIGGDHCENDFPTTIEGLAAYSAVVLSDVGALSLLYTPQTRAGRRSVNRLELLREWVEKGGALMMAGGYCSFQGIDGLAMFRGTAVEECLPIECFPGPDGVEAPEGLDPVIDETGHSILADLSSPIPYVLGMNRVAARDGMDTKTLIHCGGRRGAMPLLSIREYGAGRSLAWMTDIGPHWLSRDFMQWSGYDQLMANMVRWLTREI